MNRSSPLPAALLLACSSLLACADDDDPGVEPQPEAGTPPVAMTPLDAGGFVDAAPSTPVLDASAQVVTARDDRAVTTRGVEVVMDVAANDEPRGSRVMTFTEAAHGTVSLRPDGKLSYRPAPGFDGADELSYTLGAGATPSRATVRVQVLPSEGTVSGGVLYRAVESAHLPDATEKELERGFYWMSANAAGDAVGAYAAGRAFVRWKDGTTSTITLAPELPTEEQNVDHASWAPMGINGRGTVVGFWADPNWQIVGWSWRKDRPLTIWSAPEFAKLTPSDISDDGRVVGFREDYDEVPSQWRSFARGENDAPSSLTMFGSSMHKQTLAFKINQRGVVMGNVNDGDDGWGMPAQCFTRDLATDSYQVLPNPPGVYSVDCRGLNDKGEITGKVWRTETSFQRGFRRAGAELHEVHLPFASKPGDSKRGEEVMAITADGKLFANLLDLAGGFRAAELTPVAAEPGTSYLDSTPDLVAQFEP